MKNEFNIKYSIAFYKDLEIIISYIKYELKNSIAANNLLKKVQKEINNRLYNPLGYEEYKTKNGNSYYRIYINNYIIFYTVTNDTMEIRRIIYSKRNIDKFI